MWIFSSFFAYHMLALYSLVGLIFCASSVFFVVHGAPLEVPSFLYYLVQFGAAALHFRFRFQWLFRCTLSLCLSCSLTGSGPGARWSTHLSTAPRSRTLHPLEAYVEHWPRSDNLCLIIRMQLSPSRAGCRWSRFPFPVSRSLLLLPSSLRLFFILRCNFPCLYCLSRILQLRVRNCPPEYAFSGTGGWSLWPWNVVTWLTGLRSHATQQPLDSRPMFLVYLQTSNQQRVNCNF